MVLAYGLDADETPIEEDMQQHENIDIFAWKRVPAEAMSCGELRSVLGQIGCAFW